MTKEEVTQDRTQSSSQASTSKDNCDEEAVTSSRNEDDAMFDPDLLRDLDLSSSMASFHPPLSVSDPGEGLRLRPLRAGDFRLGFLQLLAQLTSVGEISEEQWQRRFSDMRRKSGTYNVMVLEDTDTKQVRVAASCTMCEGLMQYCADHWRYNSCRGGEIHTSMQPSGESRGKMSLLKKNVTLLHYFFLFAQTYT